MTIEEAKEVVLTLITLGTIAMVLFSRPTKIKA